MLSTEPADAIPVTVTFLEMRHAPARYPGLAADKSAVIMPLNNVPVHYYRYLIDRVGRKWHWVAMLRLSDAELAEHLKMPGRDIRVLHLDGVPAGLFELYVSPRKDVELAYFGMMEEAIGQNLGRWFLGAAIETAWSYDPVAVTVQTCTLDHPAALPLYQKLGFQPVAQVNSLIKPLSERQRADIVYGG